MSNNRRTRTRLYRIAAAFVALACFFVPTLALISYFLLVRDFIPSDRFLGTSLFVSPVVAMLLLALIAKSLWQESKQQFFGGSFAGIVKTIGLILFLPPFSLFIPHSFITMALPYALHRLSSPHDVTVLEVVLHAGPGGRSCRRPAVLEGDTFLLHRRVCGLSAEANQSLRDGGVIEVQGTASDYGLRVLRYRIPE